VRLDDLDALEVRAVVQPHDLPGLREDEVVDGLIELYVSFLIHDGPRGR
jgi:hypothetical protein